MGHARNYVSTDISRRILRDYFGFNVFFVQNVTDIDDKIIIRARQNYLYGRYVEQNPTLTQAVLDNITASWKLYAETNLPAAPASSPAAFAEWASKVDVLTEAKENPKFSMHFSALKSAHGAISSSVANPETSSKEALEAAKDVLILLLDKEEGASVRDPAIFRDLPAYWEEQFNEDMRALNVLPPTVVTRVSEYVPQIVAYVAKMMENGYAYEAQGSVYFDTAAFESGGKHVYAKLQPWSRGKKDLIDEGEGSLSVKTTADGKKSPFDFALWKASKPGEPEWASPWGQGRPGWHIECSVMASETIGSQMDIHSGGIDLAFPHHDNELAQAEAYHECNQWVNYFLHPGHLHIEGLKMSKSLKNFITIRDALNKYSVRQLRLAFALTQWNNSLDFKEGLIKEVKTFETTLNNFFAVVRALISDEAAEVKKGRHVPQRFGPPERQLFDDLESAQTDVHAALCDNLSTPQALLVLSSLVAKANVYISATKAEASIPALAEVARWITQILSVFGFDGREDSIGWSSGSTESVTDGSSSVHDIAMPYLKALSSYRDEIRRKAIAKVPYSEILQASDRVRDEDLFELGVSLDDREGSQGALIKFVDKAELLAQKAEKQAKESAKLERKQKSKEEEERKLRDRLAKGTLDPTKMFDNPDEFSAWDDNGVPTHDKDGAELAKSRRKKLQKEYDGQKKLHAEYLKWKEQTGQEL
ncbi:tRNA synthetases class I (C) catalytic domain-containing protein [Lipomyces tetrasporus]|uniref:cysteine--tRNA ligase n=1 Tax=Lipomyces tetrasporus TaxID=54092 RepID=A0AAD7QR46_9ASCO|nr:tRNA synthetases class I (C) catalytic domain-containing protein [Lipomyces tetrasporus]KAJ8099768.1 tRNA synthetases class I (C) catalytic domain-containing protein [Lipomyces tetrasporus]